MRRRLLKDGSACRRRADHYRAAFVADIDVPAGLVPPLHAEEDESILPSAAHPSFPYGNPYTLSLLPLRPSARSTKRGLRGNPHTRHVHTWTDLALEDLLPWQEEPDLNYFAGLEAEGARLLSLSLSSLLTCSRQTETDASTVPHMPSAAAAAHAAAAAALAATAVNGEGGEQGDASGQEGADPDAYMPNAQDVAQQQATQAANERRTAHSNIVVPVSQGDRDDSAASDGSSDDTDSRQSSP